MYESLTELCGRVQDNSLPLKFLIITGASDKAFAAGTDISQFRKLDCANDALDYERTMDRVIGALESLPIPTVAAIHVG